MKNVKNTKAFTLIELLVVVLIIGILAAIALPQYQKAVERARFSERQITVGALAREFEIYYLTYGQYPQADTWSVTCQKLSINIPGCTCNGAGAYLPCQHFKIDMYHFYEINLSAMSLNEALIEQSNNYIYSQWLQNTAYPNRKECCVRAASTDYEKQAQFCKSLSSQENYDRSGQSGTRCWKL